MLQKTNQTPVASVSDTTGQTHEHDPYEGLTAGEREFMERLRLFLTDETVFPAGFPFKLEVTNGVARERLTLNPANDEVFMIRRKPPGAGRRQVPIDIMSEAEAKQEIESGGSSTIGAPAVMDPCCWWEWDGVKWVCVGYGN